MRNAKVDSSKDIFNSESLLNAINASDSLFSPDKCANFSHESPADRLKKHLDFWKDIGAPSTVISIFSQGFFLPFFESPPPMIFKNNLSSLSNRDFVEQEIFDLLSKNCIAEVTQPFISNPLSVSVQASGKKRLILDLRHVNKFLHSKKVKFEDLRTAIKFFSPQGWMFNFDMKAGYHHVSIAPEHQKYLEFSWNFGSGQKFFIFRVLPFGLSVAPWLFTKLMRPLVKHWRSLGFPLLLYLDDALCIAPTKELANQASIRVQKDLERAGISQNREKSIWVPTQKITWLGLIIDLTNYKIEIPPAKREKIFLLAKALSRSKTTTARTLARFAGNVVSLWLPLGNMVKLMTKNIYYLIESRKSWEFSLNLTQAARTEVIFWLDNIKLVPTKKLLTHRLPETIILSDASSTGCGAVLKSSNIKCYRPFKPFECKESSTARELRAIIFALESFKDEIQGKTILLLTDNQACAKIVETGSMKPHLQRLAMRIFTFAIHNQINIDPRWIPRECNTEADELSKVFESDNWAVRPLFFRYFDRIWGPHQCDRFADHVNKQLPSFNSRFSCPGSAGVDAFAFDWKDATSNWLVPPVHLVIKTVQHLVACRAKGTLVCPKWPSASFWPVLFPFGAPAPFIKEVIEIPAGSSLFLPSSQPTSIFNKSNFPSPVLFLRLDAQLL